MEPLHNWIEYNAAKTIENRLIEQHHYDKLSQCDEKEAKELSIRIRSFEIEFWMHPTINDLSGFMT